MVTAVDQIDYAFLLVEIDDVLLGRGQFFLLLLYQLFPVSLQFGFVLLANFTRFAQVDNAFPLRHEATSGAAVPIAPACPVLIQIVSELALNGIPQLLVNQLVHTGCIPIPRPEPLPTARTVEIVFLDSSAEAVPTEAMLTR